MNKRIKHSTDTSVDMLLLLDLDILSIGAVKDLKDVLEDIAQKTSTFLGGEFCVVQPYEQSSDQFLLNQFTAGGNPKAKSFTWTEPRPYPYGSARTTLKDGIMPIEDYHRPEYKEKYPSLGGSVGAFRDVLPVRASLGIRLDAGKEIVGVIFVNYLDVQDFTDERIELAKQFANRAAYAIRNARIYNKALNTSRLLSTANKLTSLVGETQELMETALEDAVHLIGMDRGGIVLHEGTGGRLVASYPRSNGNQTIFQDSSLQRKIRESSNPIEVYDVVKDPELDEEERQGFMERGIKSSLITPLIARDKVFGSLGLDETKINRHFSDSEKELVKLIADVTATAIENERLYTDVIEASGRVLRKALESNVKRTEFYEYVIEETLKLMDFQAGWLLEKEGEGLRIVMTDSFHQEDIGRYFDLNKSISGVSVIRKEPILINNLEDITDKELSSVYQPPTGPKKMMSELVVPLMIGNETIGAFNIESERMNSFRNRHKEMLSLMGDQIAHAIELARLRETTKLLSELELELSQKTEMSEVLDAIIRGAIELVHGASKGYGQILLLEQDQLVTRYTTNPYKETGEPPDDLNRSYNVNECNSGIAVREEKPIIFPQIDELEYFVVHITDSETGRIGSAERKVLQELLYKRALEVEKEKIIAEYATPIFSMQNNVVGVVNIETPNKDGFNQYERNQLDKYVRQVSQNLVSAFELSNQDELNRLLKSALAQVDTKFGQLLRLAEESKGEELIIDATTGGEPLHTRIKVNDSISGECIQERAPRYIPDVSRHRKYKRFLGEEMKSEMAIPLIIEKDVIGILNLESSTPFYYAINQAIVLEAFAAQAAVAIDRAKKFQGITLSEIGAIAGDVVHRLNNPLGAISTRIELFRSKYKNAIENDQYLSQFISRTERDLKDSKAIIQELRKTYKKGSPTPINLLESVKKGLESVEELEGVQLTVDVDASLEVIASERLPYVMWNLLDNARKAIVRAKREIGQIEINAEQERGWAIIRIFDNGIGIPPAQLGLIWDPDITTTSDTGAPAHGLGLYWTKAMIESYSGELGVESELGVGTCFTIKLRSVSNQESE